MLTANMIEEKSVYGLKTNILVFVENFNGDFFDKPVELLHHLDLLFNDYIEYRSQECGYDFLEFLRFSVKENYTISDYLKELKYFKVEDDEIILKDKSSYVNLGYMYLESYDIFVSHNYLFIKDTNNGKKYVYYMD